MTETANEFTISTDVNESEIEYIERKQSEFNEFLDTLKQVGKIDEVSYKRFLLETCNAMEWDQIFEHFAKLWGDIVEMLTNHEINSLEQRLIKGSYMIDAELDQSRRSQMMEVYNELDKKLNELLKR